ncbi:MAG: NAD(P)-binding domain-containing protein [Myxococcota bacterium]
MKIAVLGTGMVGTTLASKMVERGHEVMMGSRTADNEKARAWVEASGERARHGTFEDAARFGDWVFNCTSGMASLKALEAAGAEALGDKILVDVANPLDFSQGFPPRLSVANDDSLGEQIQRAFPRTRVVKALNTVTCTVMVEPSRVPGEHDIFVCGDDEAARAAVAGFLKEDFGWPTVTDLGALSNARATEAWLLLWTRLYGRLGHADFNLRVVTAEGGGQAR